MIICERCATENPSGFRFCGRCGAPLPNAAGDGDARKIVTALFCDVVGSTALGEQLDPEVLHGVLSRYFEAMRATIERHGGTVQKYAGDAVLAVFGIPQVREDDALRAVRAAVEIEQLIPALAEEVGFAIAVRTGVNTGLVVSDAGRALAIGDAVNIAARFEQSAGPGEIVLGADTLRLVRDAVEVRELEPLTLKGKADPVPAYRLLSLDPHAPGVARRFDVKLVGRARELGVLRERWERTACERTCELVTVLGPAGVGKSRLVEELVGAVGDRARTLQGRCLHYGEGITFWPIHEALSGAGALAEPIVEHLTSGGMAAPEELFLEVRRLLETLAAQTPVILYVDDIQWAEPMLLELLEHIVDLSRGAPILVLCTARPELLEDREAWGAGRANATAVALEPLDGTECEQLLDELGNELEPEARGRVIVASEGNPLFLQEMAQLARERGVIEVPPTIQALLAARIELLSSSEREVLARGAIEGEVFHRSAVTALTEPENAGEVGSQLARLIRKDLIRPHPPQVPGDDAFRFRHLLIRDAAYERLPKSMRVQLHQRYAHWLEATAVGFVEVDEIAGWHLEQAVHQELELRRPRDVETARAAAEHLYTAGLRASDRSDLAAARNLLDRALTIVPSGDPLRIKVSLALAERLIEVGDLARADELLREAESDPREARSAALSRLEWLVYSDPGEARATIESVLSRMLDELETAGDDRGLAKAHWLGFWVRWNSSRATLAAEEIRLAARHARVAGDRGLWSRALGWYVATLIYGPQSAETIAAELDVIEEQLPGPYLQACVDIGRGEVERLGGRFVAAHELTNRAREGFRMLGIRTMTATCEQSSAWIQMSESDPAGARESLLRADAICSEFGERLLRSTTQAMIARVSELLDDPDAALAAAGFAEELSDPRDVVNFALTHEVRAWLALHAGDLAAAERWARSSVDHALMTDFVQVQARARLKLARILFSAARREEAIHEASSALALLTSKGDVPGRHEAQLLLDELRFAA